MPSTLPYAESAPSALIIEDEAGLGEELQELLQARWPALRIVGYAADGVSALRMIAQHRPDIVFLDIQIPDPNGLEVARIIRDSCHIVFVTAYDAHAIEAFENGAIDYLLKPIDSSPGSDAAAPATAPGQPAARPGRIARPPAAAPGPLYASALDHCLGGPGAAPDYHR
jgi:DNA-binding LytR/AlgR family response regulator